jgi:succinate-semialdehyde dehydrogenase / glutarate-semialdehyde dehydrogenase
MLPLVSVNPSTGEIIQTYTQLSEKELDRRTVLAGEAFLLWKETSFAHRASCLSRLGILLTERKEELALLITLEIGKPLKESYAEIEKCAWACEYFALHAENMLKDELVSTDASKSYVTFQPLGVILAVMPWNFPFWQVFRFLAPALMAGNTALLKHASNVSGCSLAIGELAREAGFPEGVFTPLLLSAGRVNRIMEDQGVKAVTLTGSTEAGKSIAEAAGRLIKKTVLELGGSDPYLILDDADIELAAARCASGRLVNNGQSCIAAKRFIVTPKAMEAFTGRFTEQMKARRTGDPRDPQTDLGPMARADLRNELHQQVLASIGKGAVCTLGGFIPEGPGAYYPPTVLTGVKPGMPAFDEELFGPVAAIIPAKDEDEAVKLANASVFGLGAAVFTRDSKRGERLALQLEAGSCFVNASVKSDPRLPFGGIRQSGYGRELSSYGIREFVNIKTVYIA